MARICNDPRGCLGVQGGHGRKTLSFSGAPCALKQPAGQARHAAREFELEQLHLQRGRIEERQIAGEHQPGRLRVLLLRGIDAFKEFDKVFIMTGGGPGTVSELLSIYAYRVNFKNWNLGYGAAVSFMVYLVVLILCSVFYKAVYWKSATVRA